MDMNAGRKKCEKSKRKVIKERKKIRILFKFKGIRSGIKIINTKRLCTPK